MGKCQKAFNVQVDNSGTCWHSYAPITFITTDIAKICEFECEIKLIILR